MKRILQNSVLNYFNKKNKCEFEHDSNTSTTVSIQESLFVSLQSTPQNFQNRKWVTRPLVLSPTVCSQYGWKCINSSLLECVSCGAKLCTPEPKIEFYDAYIACIHKILKDLKTSHKTHCPWPLAPSPESYIKMMPMPKEESLKHFLHRLQSSLIFSSSFLQIKEHILSELSLDEQHISSLCKLAEVSPDDAKEFGASVVCLAATGWTFKSQSEKGSKVFVSCDNCQRSIWTNSFNVLRSSNNGKDPCETSSDEPTIQNGKRQNTPIEDSPSLKNKRLKKEDFDPISEHRPWCLWVITHDNTLPLENDSTEEGCEALTTVPGWKIFIRSLLRNVCLSQHSDTENNPSKEKIRSVRNLLETWTDAAQ